MSSREKPTPKYDETKLAYVELIEKDYPSTRNCHMTSDNFWNCEEIRDSVTKVTDARTELGTAKVKCKEEAANWGDVFRASVLEECVEKEEVKFGKVLDPAYDNMTRYEAFKRVTEWDVRKRLEKMKKKSE